ncbi:MAG: DUF2126 domain-containing protein [Opitutales bacterium]
MSLFAAINHKTEYTYARPAQLNPQTIRLRPAPHSKSPILSYSLNISPENHFINWLQDPQGNYLARIVFPDKIEHFKIEVDLVTELAMFNPFDFFLEEYATEFPFKYTSSELLDLQPYLVDPVDIGTRFKYLVQSIDLTPKGTMDFLVELNAKIQKDTNYNIRMEPGVQTPEETLEKKSGSCRDSAWLLVNVCRALGLAARFVSGYLIQLEPDQKSLDGPSGTDHDFTDLHAWAEVYLPGAGWVGLDATSGLLTAEGHIPLACTPTPTTAAPIEGGLEPVETQFNFDMSVTRVREHPRVTKPYSDEEWNKVMALGEQIDRDIVDNDIRLTMGGEPTFISIDDMDGDEWNTEAVGPAKRTLSEMLMLKLADRWSKHGLLHYGQGKWYPGESLPRWAFTCYWRKDGEPLWRDPSLIAELEKDYGYGEKEAEAFTRHLSTVLGVEADYAMPAYEDVWYYLWKERKLPSNVNPLDNKLNDPEERARVSQIFETGLETPRGWVLPLQRQRQEQQSKDRGSWMSGSWALRQTQLFLIPGDSPVGLRLPMESQPWVNQTDYPYINNPDPTTIPSHEPFPGMENKYSEYIQRALEYHTTKTRSKGDFGPNPQTLSTDSKQREDTSGIPVVRTALCVEPRAGKLFVFMPPLKAAEDYFELIAAIEATAKALDLKVVIEGENPPFDPRIEFFKITPDPGVIEVNVHPSSNWNELVERTFNIYDDARECRLGTDKYMIDGRHTGTGGGNHIVMGASAPVDSPFLRRPDLLRSMVAYWHHHPSLSYLFSGLFVGPTSQSPRIDEARNDSLYEMEIAFKEVDRVGPNPQFWMVDRIFRNLLIDSTGNTHRAEFCIDKLYSPDGSTGRLGLLELRSFEMPPHARMSLAQQVLIRALIAHFWKKPYSPKKLARWGTQLHDKWMLPEFIWQDFQEVLQDLNDAGYNFSELWYQAHLEFRFPFYGEFKYQETRIELRNALEPWHVLGEHGATGGTVRFVDSSVERMQVKATGFNADRYILTCNGRKIPMQATGTHGEFVAAVRYRAWQPPECLHPTIEVDTPIVIDLVDTWTMRSVAGCTYHVGHPGGRNYDSFPVNSYEAESRRLSRFQAMGHTPGPITELPADEPNPEFPHTLDMRRF